MAYYGVYGIQDMQLKMQINDSLLARFYFNWINFNFLPFFFVLGLLMYALVFLSKIHIWINIFLIIPIFIVYNFELLDIIISNIDLEYVNFSTEFINHLLANSLNKYHPYIFYISLWIYLNTLNYLSLNTVLKNYFYKVPLFDNLRIYNIISLLLNFTALFMGSWWAFQEGTWGGWWNWDSSEVFGLSIGLYILFNMHIRLDLKHVTSLILEYKIYVMCIILCYSFIQLNFELASHNFGSKYHFFNNNNFLLIQHTFISLVFGYFFLYKKIKSIHVIELIEKNRTNNTLTKFNYVTILLLITISVWFIVSFSPLISHFAWNLNQISIFNSELSPITMNTVLTIFFMVIIYGVPEFNFTENFTLNMFSLPQLLPLTNSVHLKYTEQVTLIHLSILLLFYLNTLTLDPEFVEWGYNKDDLSYDYQTSLNLKNWIPSNLNYVNAASWSDLNLTTNTAWTVYQESNIPAGNEFVLLFNYTGVSNFYTLGTSYMFTYLYLTSYWLDLLTFFTLGLLFNLFFYLLTLLYKTN